MPSSACPTPPPSTPFPYTTLFRSLVSTLVAAALMTVAVRAQEPATRAEADRQRREEKQKQVEPYEPNAFERGMHFAEERAMFILDRDRKSTRLNSSHLGISYAVFCLPYTPSIYTLSLHDALPISGVHSRGRGADDRGRPRAGARHPRRGRPAAAGREAEAGRTLRAQRLRARHALRRGTRHVHPRSRSEEHTSELQSLRHLVCRLLLALHPLHLHPFPTRRSSDLWCPLSWPRR